MTRLTVERLFADPPLFAGLPQSPQFSPDGSCIAYLRLADDDRERLDLWRLDLESGRHELWLDGRQLAGDGSATAAEKAERERRRQFAHGITTFAFAPDGGQLLLPADGAAFLLRCSDGTLTRITPPDTRQTDVRFVPDGQSVSYVRDGNLYRYDLATASELPLTADGGASISNGLADFIAQEEMHRFEGYWWSPDSAYLAFSRVDETPVAESLRYEIDADAISVVRQRYPYAGAENADVRLLVLETASGSIREVEYKREQDDYLARVGWLDGNLAVQRQSRDQRALELHLYDPVSGAGKRLIAESAETWINLHDNFHPLPAAADGAPRFLWTSERDGASALYQYQAGELQARTTAIGRINRVLWADAERVLFSGWLDTATEQHLFELALDGSAAPRRLTAPAGWHEPTISQDGNLALDRWSSLQTPARLDLLHLARSGEPERRGLVAETIDAAHPYAPFRQQHRTPLLGTLRADDQQILHYRLTAPAEPHPEAGCPVIVYVYGGPGVQRVRNEWPPLLLQLFAANGYGVLEMDNRGTGNRDPGFEAPIHHRLGDVEVRDQAEAARFLATLPWVDASRIGVFGHSYGGYMTLMCLLQEPTLFKAGVAVAPVTDWHLYDTHYTERYLGTPSANPGGYAASGVIERAEDLQRPLLLVHGMADDNVLFTHTTRLIRRLQACNRSFELMTYPGSKHALQERDVSVHRFTQLLDFFGRHL